MDTQLRTPLCTPLLLTLLLLTYTREYPHHHTTPFPSHSVTLSKTFYHSLSSSTVSFVYIGTCTSVLMFFRVFRRCLWGVCGVFMGWLGCVGHEGLRSGNVHCCFVSVGGFLIIHTNRGVCLTVQTGVVVLRKCDSMNASQNWSWTAQMKLVHPSSSLCLWANYSSAPSRHMRLVQLRDCNSAPEWKCYDELGTFGLAHWNLFLKKQGERAVVRPESRHSNWTTYASDSGGRTTQTTLCQTAGEGGTRTLLLLKTQDPLLVTCSLHRESNV